MTETYLCYAGLIIQLPPHVSSAGVAVNGEVYVVAVAGGVAGAEVTAKDASIGKKKERKSDHVPNRFQLYIGTHSSAFDHALTKFVRCKSIRGDQKV